VVSATGLWLQRHRPDAAQNQGGVFRAWGQTAIRQRSLQRVINIPGYNQQNTGRAAAPRPVPGSGRKDLLDARHETIPAVPPNGDADFAEPAADVVPD
jgi:hypothetical protein